MIRVRSKTRGVRIYEVDESILTRRYYASCIDCGFCHEACCNYGCPVDVAERDRLRAYASELEKTVGYPASDWFEHDVIPDANFPSGKIQRTKVIGGKCVFFDHVGGGCHIHRFANSKSLDWRMLKPMVCSLFPIAWESGRLLVSEFLDELPCRDQGAYIFDAQRDSLAFHFGHALVLELESAVVELRKVVEKPIDKGRFW